MIPPQRILSYLPWLESSFGTPTQKSFKGLLTWDSYPVEFDGIKSNKGLLTGVPYK